MKKLHHMIFCWIYIFKMNRTGIFCFKTVSSSTWSIYSYTHTTKYVSGKITLEATNLINNEQNWENGILTVAGGNDFNHRPNYVIYYDRTLFRALSLNLLCFYKPCSICLELKNVCEIYWEKICIIWKYIWFFC